MSPVCSVLINPRRVKGRRDEKIYGHFLEHFHRQIYGGIYDPESKLSDAKGFRTDVVNALKNINTPIIRWPGGCFVSAYNWKDGISERTPSYDKAWRVEEPNTFGTNEFIEYCKLVDAEPYICTNAGTGTLEDMSDWVEYCNLKNAGKWAKKRIENGHLEPFNVKYWSIGNENYGDWEIGAKEVGEWGRFVKESAKMMRRVDPSIQLLAASISDLNWNLDLLREAGKYLDWISIHGYWDRLAEQNNLSSYETCMAFSLKIEEPILKTKYILGSLGFLGKIRIAFDEWNLRGWHHPRINDNYEILRDKNDINSSYTMADAVFSACFLNQCLKHCDIVGMANFSPTVNTRGAIFTYNEGIILRSTYFVFELYSKFMGDTVVDAWIDTNDYFEVQYKGEILSVPSLDIVATKSTDPDLRVAIVNRNPDKTITLELDSERMLNFSNAEFYSLVSKSKDDFNDINQPHAVKVQTESLTLFHSKKLLLEVPPHSVNVLVLN